MKISQLLIDAKQLIADPSCWTKGEYARNKEGQKTADSSNDACQWCAVGALWRASGFLRGNSAFDSVKGDKIDIACCFLLEAIGRERKLSLWNDLPETTHHDVMNAYNKAIELAYKKENNCEG